MAPAGRLVPVQGVPRRPGPHHRLRRPSPPHPVALTGSLHATARRPALAAYGLAGLLAAAGITHFALPRFYDAIVPHVIPGPPRAWTLVSGVVELACAAALAVPRTRRLGATAAAVLFVAVFPANIQMAVDWRSRSALDQVIAYGRLPLQIPLVLWALAVRKSAP